MAKNVSVQRFIRLTEELRREVREGAVAELNRQASELARLIEMVAPRDEGELKTTVRVVPGKTETIVRVVAGGPPTTSDGYDYARGIEFGTVKMLAQPFFFPTYRLRRKQMRSAMKRKISAQIKKRSAK